MQPEVLYTPKQINYGRLPSLFTSVSHNTSPQTDFFRSCSLCADGAVALTASDSRKIALYTLYGLNGCIDGLIKVIHRSSRTTGSTAFPPPCDFPQPDNVLGTLWYPTATPEDPSAFCFLASVRECPVKLLDASDGRLRASYRIVDHRERHIAPHSMAFNNMASKLYCGFQDAIEIFDVNYPGEGDRLPTTPSKKTKSGLKGIISSLAFCPDYSGLYAAGTFSSSLALFAESSQAEIVQSLGGVKGPVTQIKFNPMHPHLVYATSRQTNCILGWDIRGDTSAPFQEFERSGLTNQRLSFDVDSYGKTMVTGDKDGFISCFDVGEEASKNPTIKYKAHNDAIAAVVFQPFKPILVSVSGSRNLNNDEASPSSDSELSSSDSERRPYAISRDTSLKMWTFHVDDQPEACLA